MRHENAGKIFIMRYNMVGEPPVYHRMGLLGEDGNSVILSTSIKPTKTEGELSEDYTKFNSLDYWRVIEYYSIGEVVEVCLDGRWRRALISNLEDFSEDLQRYKGLQILECSSKRLYTVQAQHVRKFNEEVKWQLNSEIQSWFEGA